MKQDILQINATPDKPYNPAGEILALIQASEATYLKQRLETQSNWPKDIDHLTTQQQTILVKAILQLALESVKQNTTENIKYKGREQQVTALCTKYGFDYGKYNQRPNQDTSEKPTAPLSNPATAKLIIPIRPDSQASISTSEAQRLLETITKVLNQLINSKKILALDLNLPINEEII